MNIRNWHFWRDGDRLRLRVESAHPWWQFWRARIVTCSLARGDVIEFYQSLAKAQRPLFTQGQDEPTDEEEFADDIRRAIATASQAMGTAAAPDGPTVVRLLIQKGYVKA